MTSVPSERNVYSVPGATAEEDSTRQTRSAKRGFAASGPGAGAGADGGVATAFPGALSDESGADGAHALTANASAITAYRFMGRPPNAVRVRMLTGDPHTDWRIAAFARSVWRRCAAFSVLLPDHGSIREPIGEEANVDKSAAQALAYWLIGGIAIAAIAQIVPGLIPPSPESNAEAVVRAFAHTGIAADFRIRAVG